MTGVQPKIIQEQLGHAHIGLMMDTEHASIDVPTDAAAQAAALMTVHLTGRPRSV